MLLRILIFFFLIGLTSCITPSFYEDQDIANIVKSHGVEGAVVISSLDNGKEICLLNKPGSDHSPMP